MMKVRLFLFSILLVSVGSCKQKNSITEQKGQIRNDKEDVAFSPPMGWNSYNCYGSTVTEQEMMDNALMMSVHLKEYGWQYVVVDYCWFYPFPGAMNNPPQTLFSFCWRSLATF